MTTSAGGRVFRGIRYASAARLEPSVRLGAPAVLEPGEDGPICPQRPSRIEAVIGPPPASPQSEDCLSLTITTPPGPLDGAVKRPVIVWVPGGNFTIGAGSWPMYDARRLCTEGDLVVVSVNYRLGPFGFLRVPGSNQGNLGISDVLNALAWVQEHIGVFGGDPARVTLAGQSAGALAAAFVMGLPEADGYYSSVLMQSAPLGLRFQDEATAGKRAHDLVARLGGRDPRTVEVADLLDATVAAAYAKAGWAGVNTGPVFAPLLGVDGYPDQATHDGNVLRRARDLPVLMSTTTAELSAMRGNARLVRSVHGLPVIGPAVASALTRQLDRAVYTRPVRRLVEQLAGAGAHVYLYESSVASAASPFGATHCSDIPFVLGTEASWRDAPMLRGWTWDEVHARGSETRQAWISFARDGVPVSDGLRWTAQDSSRVAPRQIS